jgi:hypothetical protein
MPIMTKRMLTRSIRIPPPIADKAVMISPMAIAEEISVRLQPKSASRGLISTLGAERMPHITSESRTATATTTQP